ncbi:RidA family protein [Risungbinella massiliensis]|uniref:RidA family protein n=1 Tax=Risungbinella massiliensis TaxID=1329796 RepID=UPI0005CC7C94|nr:RidA family protein [Risungbinella massiliensis]
MKKVDTQKAPAAIGAYSQAIEIDGWIFTSGQIPLLADGTLSGESIEIQTHQVLRNVHEVLREAGADLCDVIKTTLFIQDMSQFATINQIYSEYFGHHAPARSCVEVSRLPKDVLIEMEVIAKVKK